MSDNPEKSIQQFVQSDSIELYEILAEEINADVVFPSTKTVHPSLNVRAITFDEQGYIWGIGNGGVIRWTTLSDRITFRWWRSEHGLADSPVLALIQAANRIICGHMNGWVSVIENGAARSINLHTYHPVLSLVDIDDHIYACCNIGLINIDTLEIIETPEAVLCAATGLDTLWIGTECGLFSYHHGAWKPHALQAPIRCLAGSHETLWVGTQSACYAVTSDTHTALPIDGTAYQILRMGRNAMFATSTGIFRYNSKEQKVFPIKHGKALFVGYAGQKYVMSKDDSVILKLPTKERHLLPNHNHREPHQLLYVTPRHESLYGQALNGSIWKYYSGSWTQISFKDYLFTDAVEFDGDLFMSFLNQVGLVRQHHDELSPIAGVSFARRLLSDKDRLFVLTLDSVQVSLDGKQFETLPLDDPTNSDHQFGCGLDIIQFTKTESVYVVSSAGIYEITYDHLRLVLAFPESATFAAFDKQVAEVVIVTTSEILVINLEGLEIIRRYAWATRPEVTAITAADGHIFVGTNTNLFILDGDQVKGDGMGIAGRAILSLCVYDNNLWVGTESGMNMVSLKM